MSHMKEIKHQNIQIMSREINEYQMEKIKIIISYIAV